MIWFTTETFLFVSVFFSCLINSRMVSGKNRLYHADLLGVILLLLMKDFQEDK